LPLPFDLSNKHLFLSWTHSIHPLQKVVGDPLQKVGGVALGAEPKLLAQPLYSVPQVLERSMPPITVLRQAPKVYGTDLNDVLTILLLPVQV